MTKKISLIILSLALLLLPVLTATAQELLPELKAKTIIDDNVIVLGDLFTGLDAKQDLVIAEAPAPGQKILISARHILKFTRAHGNIRWRNSASVKNVVVNRASTIVAYTDITDLLASELKNVYHTEQNLDVRLYNRNGKIHLPVGFEAADLSIRNLSLDRNNDKFSALVAAPTGDGNETLHTINGRTIRVTMVPIISRTLRRGDVITASDISWTSLPDTQVSRNIIRSSDKLIGMTPRSQIKSGNPVRLNEVTAPVLVARGALVKINFSTSKISLSTIGKAMEAGGRGDVIQVKNNASNKIVTAVVRDHNQVEVFTDAGSLVSLGQ